MEQAVYGPGEIAVRLAGVLALVFANAFFVAAEFSLVTVRKTRIDQLIAEGSSLARPIRRVLAQPETYIASTQLAITMASLGLGWIGEPALASLIQPLFGAVPVQFRAVTIHSMSVAVAFVIITSLHIVLGELAPKTIALQHAERTALIVTRPVELFMHLFWPFIAVLNRTGRGVVRLLGLKPPSGSSMVHSEEELKMLVTASQEAGVIEEDEEQMLHRVFGFGDLTAGQVMVPRTEMIALPVRASRADLLERLADVNQRALPVYRTSVDDISGVVRIRDLFRLMSGGGDQLDLGPAVRDVLTVPETIC